MMRAAAGATNKVLVVLQVRFPVLMPVRKLVPLLAASRPRLARARMRRHRSGHRRARAKIARRAAAARRVVTLAERLW